MSERVPENFLPWEQIEPLIRYGMTGKEVARAVRDLLGLPEHGYQLRMPGSYGLDLLDALRCGLIVEKRGATPISDANKRVVR